jgi:hypothetical protein
VIVIAILLVALVAVVIIASAAFVDTADTAVVPQPDATTQHPIPAANPVPVPKPKNVPPKQRPEVRDDFSGNASANGKRLDMGVGKLDRIERCIVHSFTVNGHAKGAFMSNCSDWESGGTDVLFFYVGLKNVEDRAMKFNLRDFVLVTRDGRTFGPVNVRSQADKPPNFLPETGLLPPHSKVVGYLTFDGRATGVVPARLSYVDGDQTLTIVFDGRPGVL